MTKMIPAAVALAAVLTVAGSAHAETTSVVVMRQTVSYPADVLATPQGAQWLLDRVDGVALRMCRRTSHSAFDRPVASRIEACRTKAVARVVAELNAPLVTAAYGRRESTTVAER